MFSKDFSDKLRSMVLISDVIGKKVKLKQHGKEFQGLCPFHNEKTPSFTVNNQKGFYHCFGCGAHGDIFTFVMSNEGLEYKEAVHKLADDFSVEIPVISHNKKFVEDINYKICQSALQFFQDKLWLYEGEEARKYLTCRGFAIDDIKKFAIGYAPNSFDALIKFLKSQSFSDLAIKNSGLVSAKDNQEIYDKFRKRIIFPIFNQRNQVIAFGGRVLGDELPKYLNSAETTIFKKKETLYNFNIARKSIFDKGYAILVEGYMDAISLAMNGFENVVAGLGTAIGESHLQTIFLTTNKLVIALDGDNAGINAVKRLIYIALPIISADKNISIITVPEKLDPDDFIKKFGQEKFQTLIDNAINISKACWQFSLQDLKIDINNKDTISPENKAKLQKILEIKSDLIADKVLKKHFIDFFRESLFFLGKNIFAQKGNNIKHLPQKREFFNNISTASSLSIASGQENKQYQALSQHNKIIKEIIALLLKFPQLVNFKNDDFEFEIVELSSDDYTAIKEILCEFIAEFNVESLLKVAIFFERVKNFITKKDALDIENIIKTINYNDSKFAENKLHLLLLEDLLIKINQQSRILLDKITRSNNIEDSLLNQKISDEIFNYKSQVEKKILHLKQDNF